MEINGSHTLLGIVSVDDIIIMEIGRYETFCTNYRWYVYLDETRQICGIRGGSRDMFGAWV